MEFASLTNVKSWQGREEVKSREREEVGELLFQGSVYDKIQHLKCDTVG